MHASMTAMAAHEDEIHYRDDDGDDRKNNQQRRCVRVGDSTKNNAQRNIAYSSCSNVTFAGVMLDRNAVMPSEQPGREQGI